MNTFVIIVIYSEIYLFFSWHFFLLVVVLWTSHTFKQNKLKTSISIRITNCFFFLLSNFDCFTLTFFVFVYSRGREDRVHPDAPGGLRRYLVQGDRVLRYSLLWNDERCGGGPQLLCLNIYLKDNTMEMLYPSGTNAGRGERKFLFFWKEKNLNEKK